MYGRRLLPLRAQARPQGNALQGLRNGNGARIACPVAANERRTADFICTKKAVFTTALFDEFDSSFNRGAHGANPRTGTTGNTGFGVNNVLSVTLGNRADRAFTLAGATADALIVDDISHE